MKNLRLISLLLTALILIASSAVYSYCASFEGDDRIVIVLDPGHGGADPGAPGIRSESFYNLKVAEYCKNALDKNGSFSVYMTRTADYESYTLPQRADFANRVNADIIISIHFNASENSAETGVEAYTSVIDRFYMGELCRNICSEISKVTKLDFRDVYRKKDFGDFLYYWSEDYQWSIPYDSSAGQVADYYGIISWPARFGIPGIIIEHAFLSNERDRKIIDDDKMLKAIGEADAKAIIDYYTGHSHSYGAKQTDIPVSCFSTGKQSVHCSICGHRKDISEISDSVDPSRHIWMEDDGNSTVTCTSDGVYACTCLQTSSMNEKGLSYVPVHTKREVTPALGHNYELIYERPVAHAEDGIKTYSCKRCSDTYDIITPCEGHSFAVTETVSPTCTEDGFTSRKCSVCGEETTETIPATGHDFEILSKTEASCESEGSCRKKCRICGDEEDEVLSPLGHEYEIISKKESTCTMKGSEEKKCRICGKTVTEETSLIPHSFETVSSKDATCSEDGTEKLECTVCGFKDEIITPALGHDWNGGTISDYPSLLIGGKKLFTCTKCGEMREEKISSLSFEEYRSAYPNRSRAVIIGGISLISVLIIGTGVIIFLKIRKKKKKNNAQP